MNWSPTGILRRASLLGALAVLLGVGWVGWFGLPLKRPGKAQPRLAIQPPPGVAHLPAVRVALHGSAVAQCRISASQPIRVRLAGTAQVLFTLERLPESTVELTGGQFVLAGKKNASPRLELDPGPEGKIWVDDHEYRGTIRLIRTQPDRFRAINLVPLEDYIASVIDGEMPLEFGAEARKAQAIAARTYALYQMQQAPPAALYDVFSGTRSQKYLGTRYRAGDGRLLAGESSDSRRIAQETAGMVCLYQGRLFSTYYSAVCGGATSVGRDFFDDAVPPLRSAPCTWCTEARLFQWDAELTTAEVQSRVQTGLQAEGVKLGPIKSLVIAPEPYSGGVSRVTLGDGRATHTVPATLFRRWIGTDKLYSHHVACTPTSTGWKFTGRGHGHGVGLCQWGARGQDHAGRTGLQILAQYYPGAEVVVLSE